jgi:hypothetical protein
MRMYGVRHRWSGPATTICAAMAAVLLIAPLAWAQTGAPAVTMHDLSGWEFVGEPATPVSGVATLTSDGVVQVTGKPVGYLATMGSHHDYRLHAEWRWPGTPGNGGILVSIATGPRDRQWPVSFQVQLKNTAVGDILPMAGATFSEPLSTPPNAKTPLLTHAAPDSERPAGEWNTADIVTKGDTIEVTINGVLQNRVTHCSVAEGQVGFQLEGTPFELRNISVTPLTSK